MCMNRNSDSSLDLLITETLKDFKKFVLEDPETTKAIKSLREKVINFSSGFPMPGYDDH